MTLAGRRVLVTRARAQAGSMIDAIEAAGGIAIAVPVIERSFDVDPTPVRAALAGRIDAVVLTSVNAVEGVGRHLSAPVDAPVYCVGPKTAAAVDAARFTGERVVPDAEFRAESVVAAIADRWPGGGARLVLPRGAHGRELLLDELTARGFEVAAPEVYTIRGRRWTPEERERAEPADIVTFLSGRTLEALLEAFDDARGYLERRTVAVIGPVAAEAAETLGVRVDVVPTAATVEALVEALIAERSV